MKIRLTAKRFVLGAIVVALMVQIVVIPAKFSFAASGLDNTDYVASIANVMRMMNDAAKMQLLTQKVQKCMLNSGLGKLPNELIGGIQNSLIWDDGMIWRNSALNDTAIGAGYYLESITNSNKTQDGKIFCGEGGDGAWTNGLFHTFVETLKSEKVISGDKAWQQVICHKDDPSMMGILGRIDAACDTGLKAGGGTASFARRVEDQSNAYLGELYNEWVANYMDDDGNVVGNKYAVPYGSIEDYGGTTLPDGTPKRLVGATAYYLWSKEISVFCAGYRPSSDDEFSTSDVAARSGDQKFDTQLDWIGTQADEGAAVRKIGIIKAGPGGNGGGQTSSFGANRRSCSTGNNAEGERGLIEEANAAVGNVQAEYREILTALCKEEITKQIAEARQTLAQRYPNGEAYSTGDQTAFDELVAFENQTGLDKYIVDEKTSEGNHEGGWQCVDADQLAFLTQIQQGAYGNDEENNTSGGTDPNADATPTCYDGGGALGWILCPLLDAMGNAINRLYDSIIAPFLTVDIQLFTVDGDQNGTYRAWTLFQGIANILFVILLLVVIFSQLTGVGIDNYGIKKILPKLIIVAILINLSYIICQLLVELSNVLGYGLKGFLDSIANEQSFDVIIEGVKDASGNVHVSQETVSAGATALTAVVAVVGVGAGAGAILAGGFAFILPVLLGLLSAIIALIFTFVLLGVRQAGVVLLVAVSPLAFVCYMLPNTKKLFDKWRKIFQGLLLFFPICGLLMGAGNLSSKILLEANNSSFLMALTAMILNIVPLFFLPTLLKSAFAAMGNIGAKISGVGKGMSGKMTKGIRESDGYKNVQMRKRAGLDRNGNPTRVGRLRSRIADSKAARSRLGSVLTFGGAGRARRSMAQGRQQFLKNEREQGNIDTIMSPEYIASQQSKMKADQLDAAADAAYENYASDTKPMPGSTKTLANSLAEGGTVGRVALETAWGQAKTSEQKVALARLASTTKGGRGSLREFLNNPNNFDGDAQRAEVGRAMQRTREFGTLDQKAGDVADYFRKDRVSMKTASKELSLSAKNVNEMEDHTFEALKQEENEFITGIKTHGVPPDPADKAAAVSLLNQALDSDTNASSKIRGKIEEQVGNLGGQTTAQAQQTQQATQVAQQTAQQAAMAAQQAAQQTQHEEVFDVQRQAAQGIHEQNAANRGKENLTVGPNSRIRGFAAPAGFDMTTATHGANGWVVERNGQKWNISKGRFES